MGMNTVRRLLSIFVSVNVTATPREINLQYFTLMIMKFCESICAALSTALHAIIGWLQLRIEGRQPQPATLVTLKSYNFAYLY